MNLGMREMPEDTERKSWYKMEKRQKVTIQESKVRGQEHNVDTKSSHETRIKFSEMGR